MGKRPGAVDVQPLREMIEAYQSGFQAFSQLWQPTAKTAARWQAEAVGLASRRAQACLELPARLAKCRTAEDVMREQARFWQTAGEHYAESSGRLMNLWLDAVGGPATAEAGAKPAEPDAAPTRPTLIAFPDRAKDAPAARGSRTKGKRPSTVSSTR